MEKFYFDSYGVQPPSELITYLKSPIFYDSERVQQNGDVFLRPFMSLRIEAAFVGKYSSNCNKLFNIIITKMPCRQIWKKW